MKLSTWLLAFAGLGVGAAAYFVSALALNEDFGLVAIFVGLAVSFAAMFGGAWGKKPAINLAILTGIGLILVKVGIAAAIGGSEGSLPTNFELNDATYQTCLADAAAWAQGGKSSPDIFVDQRKHYWHVKDSTKLQPGDLNRFKAEWAPRLEKWAAKTPTMDEWKADVTQSAYEDQGFGARLKAGFSFFNIIGFGLGIAAAYLFMASRKPLIGVNRTTKTDEDGYHEIR
ncbi:hypothetical protein OAU50_07455 [Planctomycetota bacterium]|nr:hypothetical protein [Planctomycetota bacterium]